MFVQSNIFHTSCPPPGQVCLAPSNRQPHCFDRTDTSSTGPSMGQMGLPRQLAVPGRALQQCLAVQLIAATHWLVGVFSLGRYSDCG